MIELKKSKTTYLGRVDGRNKYVCNASIRAKQMREPNGEWQDIDPYLVRDANGLHIEGAPYAIEITGDGDRKIYPNRDDLSKWIRLPVPDFIRALPKTIERNRIVAHGEKFDVIYLFSNTGVHFEILIREPISIDRIKFGIESLGLDIKQLLASSKGLGIPRPRLVEADKTLLIPQTKMLEWSFDNNQLELGFDLSGLKFPICLRNTTIEKEVEASTDDGHTWGTDSISLTDTFVYIEVSTFRGWFRFDDVIFDNVVTIDHAYLDLCAYAAAEGSSNLRIKCIKEDDTATFGSGDANPDSRALTDASTPWAAENWVEGTFYGYTNETTDIKAPVQEMADTYDFSGGKALAFKVYNDGVVVTRRVRSVDYVGGISAPECRIEWSAAGPPAQAVGNGAVTIVGALTTIGKFKSIVGSGAIAPSGALNTIGKFKQPVGSGAVSISGALKKKTFKSVGGGAVGISGFLSARLVGIVLGMKHILKLILFHY